MNRLYASAGIIALSAMLGWTSYQILARNTDDAFASCRSGSVAGGQIGGPFELVDQAGQTVTDQQILQKPALIYFGFTSCADVCPLDNARNAEAVDLLAAKGLDVTPVFITVDPKRDTPEIMADYISNFSDKMVGLTGSVDQITAAARAYKVYFQIPANDGGNYQVDHTTLTYLVLPKTGFAEFFQRDTTAEEMAERTSCFLKAS